MTTARTRTLTALAAALVLTACSGTDSIDPSGDVAPTQSTVEASIKPDPVELDQQTAVALVVARFEAVYGLPPTPPDRLDLEAAGEGIVAPGSREAERISGVLTQARDLGVIDRGDVRAEALTVPTTTGAGQARVTVCMSH